MQPILLIPDLAEYPLTDHPAHVINAFISDSVNRLGADAITSDQPRRPEDRQVLGDPRLGNVQTFGEGANVLRSLLENQKQLKSVGIGESAKAFGYFFDQLHLLKVKHRAPASFNNYIGI